MFRNEDEDDDDDVGVVDVIWFEYKGICWWLESKDECVCGCFVWDFKYGLDKDEAHGCGGGGGGGGGAGAWNVLLSKGKVDDVVNNVACTYLRSCSLKLLLFKWE